MPNYDCRDETVNTDTSRVLDGMQRARNINTALCSGFEEVCTADLRVTGGGGISYYSEGNRDDDDHGDFE